MIFETFLKPAEHPIAAMIRARSQAIVADLELEWRQSFPAYMLGDDWLVWISRTTPMLYGWHLLGVWVGLPDEDADALLLIDALRPDIDRAALTMTGSCAHSVTGGEG